MKPLNKQIENYLSVSVIILFASIFLFYTWHLGDTILDPGDGVKHYLIAKYSWEMPHLLFDHWGKPLFTILSSPFAQIGFEGMIIFNIILFLITCIYLLKISVALELKYSIISVVFCFVAPVYFRDVLSGLTEVLFATILTITVYYFVKQRYVIGCLIYSFASFSRPEASLVLPFIILFLFCNKQYKSISILLTGTIIFSLLGWSFYNDVFWVFTQRPYSTSDTYGSGSLWHFVSNYRNTLGYFLSFFFVLGTIAIIVKTFKLKKNPNTTFLLLLLLSVFSVFGGHSIMWWKGLQGSAGLLRVITTVIPIMSIIALYGVDFTLNRLIKHNIVSPNIVITIIIVCSSFFVYNRAKKLVVDSNMIQVQQTLSDAAIYCKKNHPRKNIVTIHPFFSYKSNINPFLNYSNKLAVGDLILWETQFSPLEGKMPLTDIQNNPDFKLLKSFYSKDSVTFHGNLYEVHFFKKVN